MELPLLSSSSSFLSAAFYIVHAESLGDKLPELIGRIAVCLILVIFILIVVLVLLLFLLFELFVYLGKASIYLFELSRRTHGGILRVVIVFNGGQIRLLLLRKDRVERRCIECCKHITLFDILADLDVDSQDFCAVYRDKVPLLRRRDLAGHIKSLGY